MNAFLRIIRRLTGHHPAPVHYGQQDFEVGTYITPGHYAPEPTEDTEPADIVAPLDGWTDVGYVTDEGVMFDHKAFATHALLVRDVPNFAGIGAQLVIPAGNTDGEWRPLGVAPGVPEYEYQRDGNKVLVRRVLPDFPRLNLRDWTP